MVSDAGPAATFGDHGPAPGKREGTAGSAAEPSGIRSPASLLRLVRESRGPRYPVAKRSSMIRRAIGTSRSHSSMALSIGRAKRFTTDEWRSGDVKK